MTRTDRLSRLGLAAAALMVVATLALPGPLAEEYTETKRLSTDSLEVRNLIGEITVTGSSGSDFEVVVQVRGKDASRDTIRIEAGGDELTVVFPKSSSFVYPKMGGGKTSFTPSRGDSGWLSQVLGGIMGDRITVTGQGSGTEVWADLEIRVPSGAELSVRHGVGEVHAENVEGDLLLDTNSGKVSAMHVAGNLVVDTGSGHVQVEDVRGELSVDTGSGHVEALRIDGESVSIDTGSGRVTLEDVTGERVVVDTGSGSVKASRVRADSANIDTGSGSVTLELDEMGSGDFVIDTGSGRITLAVPAGASASVRAETGSGGIDLDLDEPVTLTRQERDEIAFSLGGGDARVRLSTGSGGIRITRSN